MIFIKQNDASLMSIQKLCSILGSLSLIYLILDSAGEYKTVIKIEAGSTSCFSFGGHVEWPHERVKTVDLCGETDVYRSCVCLLE